MLKQIKIIALLSLMPVLMSAKPQPLHPNLKVSYLLDKCDEEKKKSDEEKKADIAYCYGFFFAVNYALQDFQEKIICMPKNIRHTDQIKTFVNWAQQNPDKKDTDQLIGIINALGAAYPCE